MAQSAVGNLRDALDGFGQMSGQAAESMDELKAQYQGMSEHVLTLIAGTSTGKDREVTNAIEEAARAVGQAQDALVQAAATAREYGDSL